MPSGGGFTFTLLFSLTGSGGPFASLTIDAAGNIYGTTSNDGGRPFSNVIFDANRNLYGTTFERGADAAGVVFAITP